MAVAWGYRLGVYLNDKGDAGAEPVEILVGRRRRRVMESALGSVRRVSVDRRDFVGGNPRQPFPPERDCCALVGR